MAMISLRDYALKHGKSELAYHRVVKEGRFKTAKKIGRLWVVDENEPPPEDKRVRNGQYRNWRKHHSSNEKEE